MPSVEIRDASHYWGKNVGETEDGLREELGIGLGRTSPLIEVRHDYGDKQVLLDVHIVWEHSGEARGLEDQPLAWVEVDALAQYEFPAANVPIVKAAQAKLSDTF